VSVGAVSRVGNRDDSSSVGYDLGVRSLDSRVGGIVGASGCLYAIRRELQQAMFPTHLSRDFASAMIAYEHGFRAVSVDDARFQFPRATSLRAE